MISTVASEVDRLRRWVEYGGTLAASEPGPDGVVVVSLRRCDGGEEADRLLTDDPAVLDYLAEHAGP